MALRMMAAAASGAYLPGRPRAAQYPRKRLRLGAEPAGQAGKLQQHAVPADAWQLRRADDRCGNGVDDPVVLRGRVCPASGRDAAIAENARKLQSLCLPRRDGHVRAKRFQLARQQLSDAPKAAEQDPASGERAGKPFQKQRKRCFGGQLRVCSSSASSFA